MQPSFPKVAITNLSLGSLKRIETSALGIDDASVHVCETCQKELLQKFSQN